MNRDLRTVTAWIRKQWPGRSIPDDVHEAACRLSAPRRKAPPRTGPSRKTEKRAEREERQAARSAVREAAMLRDGGRCVLCGYEDRINDGRFPLHMHHVCGRREERIDTVAMLCETDHKATHAGELVTLRRLATWCVRHGYGDAARHLARRIAKAEDIRARAAARAAGEGR